MTTLPNEPGPRYEPLLQLLRTSEVVWNASRIFFARWAVSPSQFNVLNLLEAYPAGLTQVELSRTLIMHRSNVTGLVDRLEERGLVRRCAQANDRRAYRVTLTAAGQKLVRAIHPHYFAAAEEVWGKISAGQAKELAAILAEIAKNAKIFQTDGSGTRLSPAPLGKPQT